MIQMLDGLPDNVVGFRAVGKVSADDYEATINPAIENASESGDGLRVLYLLGADFDGFEVEAGLDDMKMGMRHWSQFEKIALVTDNGSYRTMTKAFGFLMHGEVKVFSVGALDEARSWVAG